jgi:NitT/TauT family transport system substrate-binding protein
MNSIKEWKKRGVATLAGCVVCLLLLAAAGCGNGGGAAGNKADVVKSIRVVMPDGAPLLSLAKMRAENFAIEAGYEVSYETLPTADLLTAVLVNEEADFAIAPVNVCSVMYNNGKGYRLAGVSIWGIMHIVSDQPGTQTLESLKGETILAFTKGGTPGITLRSILTQNNIAYAEGELEAGVPSDTDAVNIVYLNAADEVRNALVAGRLNDVEIRYALLPEPVATAIAGATSGKYSAKINLQDEWEKANDGEHYPQAGLIFHERLLASDAAFVEKFIALADMSTGWAFNNPLRAGNLAKDALNSSGLPGGVPVQAAVRAGRLPLQFVYADEAQKAVSAYLEIIAAENAALTGGKLPDDAFYYAAR